MAISFREASRPVQAVVFAALAVVIAVLGEYLPPPMPWSARRQELAQARARDSQLKQQGTAVQDTERRSAALQAAMSGSQKQLALLEQAVPEEKELDQFMLQLQQAATLSGVALRRLTAKPIVSRQYHYEMPFEVEMDGAYYGIEAFFERLSRMPRMVNVKDMALATPGSVSKYKPPAGSTVRAIFTVVTFFTQGPQPASPAVAPSKP